MLRKTFPQSRTNKYKKINGELKLHRRYCFESTDASQHIFVVLYKLHRQGIIKCMYVHVKQINGLVAKFPFFQKKLAWNNACI